MWQCHLCAHARDSPLQLFLRFNGLHVLLAPLADLLSRTTQRTRPSRSPRTVAIRTASRHSSRRMDLRLTSTSKSVQYAKHHGDCVPCVVVPPRACPLLCMNLTLLVVIFAPRLHPNLSLATNDTHVLDLVHSTVCLTLWSNRVMRARPPSSGLHRGAKIAVQCCYQGLWRRSVPVTTNMACSIRIVNTAEWQRNTIDGPFGSGRVCTKTRLLHVTATFDMQGGKGRSEMRRCNVRTLFFCFSL